jgi:hypothetical protein
MDIPATMNSAKRRCVVVAIVCAIPILAMLLLASARLWFWGEGDYSCDERTFDAKQLAMVEKCTTIALPPGSRGLNLMYDGSHVDPSFIAKIEIPPSSEEAMIKQLERIPYEEIGVSGSMTEKAAWWNPSPSTTIMTRVSETIVRFVLVRVWLCKENGRVVLYLEWIHL